jgi:hypothetical protein
MAGIDKRQDAKITMINPLNEREKLPEFPVPCDMTGFTELLAAGRYLDRKPSHRGPGLFTSLSLPD